MSAAARSLRIELLGQFRVAVESHEVPAESWRRSKAAGLVKLLALAPAHRLHREQVMDALWPELAPAAAAANLRKAVHYARRAIDGEEESSLVVSAGELLSLPREGARVDVDAFRAAAAQARRSGDPDAYAAAVELYRDELLPEDRYEEWTIARPRRAARGLRRAARGARRPARGARRGGGRDSHRAPARRGGPDARERLPRADAPAGARRPSERGPARVRAPACSALLNPVAAETSSALDDAGAAAVYAESAAGIAGMFDSSAWRAMAESALASVASAEGDGPLARERFEAAAGMYERAGQPYWRERSLALAAAT